MIILSVISLTAYGHVLIGAGLVDEAVEYFTSLTRVSMNRII